MSKGALKKAPASAILDEVDTLISVQIETFGQRAPLTSSQLSEFHSRTEKIKMLYEALDQGTEEQLHARN